MRYNLGNLVLKIGAALFCYRLGQTLLKLGQLHYSNLEQVLLQIWAATTN